MPRTRDEWARHDLDYLQRKREEVAERTTRAETMESALHDEYVLQEIDAAIAMKEGAALSHEAPRP